MARRWSARLAEPALGCQVTAAHAQGLKEARWQAAAVAFVGGDSGNGEREPDGGAASMTRRVSALDQAWETTTA